MSLLTRRMMFAGSDAGGGGGGGSVDPGPTFVPSDLASLALWFKADAITGLADSDPVSQWDDSSGNGRHALQGTGANQPLYKTGVQNGLPAVRFDGTNDYLLTSTFGSALTQPNMIFVVAKWGGPRTYLFDGVGSTRNALGHEVGSSGSGRTDFYAGSVVGGSVPARPTTIECWSVLFNGSSSTLRYRGSMWITGLSPGTQPLGALTIGAGNGGGFGHLDGDVFEIVAYNATLTNAERWQVEQYLSDKWQVNIPRRPDLPQTTPTYDASGEATHPSVIDFDTKHGLATWNGHRYWMAMTPYPTGNSAAENPSILVSSDGETWTEPAGISNPVDPQPPGGHNADTELEYDPDTSTLHLYYVDEGSGTYRVLHRSSTDGVTWSAETVLISSTTVGNLSPTVVYDGSTWHMWTVDFRASPNTLLYRSSSSPDSGWSAATTCTVNNVPAGRDMWHPMVFEDPRDGTYHCFMALSPSGTSGGATDLALMRSSNGTTWYCSDVVMENSYQGARWDRDAIYRATGQLKDEDTYAVWYSARAGSLGSQVWRIGYGELSTWEAPTLP